MSSIRRPVKFIAGLELARRLYLEGVKPILVDAVSDVPYAAGLLGSGSEVQSFDDEMSTDHHYGPRLQLFLSQDDHSKLAVEAVTRYRYAGPLCSSSREPRMKEMPL